MRLLLPALAALQLLLPVATPAAIAGTPELVPSIAGEIVFERKSGRCQGGEPRAYKPGCGGGAMGLKAMGGQVGRPSGRGVGYGN